MRAASAEWLASTEARVLIEVPMAPTAEQHERGMRNRLERAFAAGFAAGRTDDRKEQKQPR
jgi:hypothetical protein